MKDREKEREREWKREKERERMKERERVRELLLFWAVREQAHHKNIYVVKTYRDKKLSSSITSLSTRRF